MDSIRTGAFIIALIGGGQEINTGEAGPQVGLMRLLKYFQALGCVLPTSSHKIEYAKGRDVNFESVANAQPVPKFASGDIDAVFPSRENSHMVHHLIHNNPQARRKFTKHSKTNSHRHVICKQPKHGSNSTHVLTKPKD